MLTVTETWRKTCRGAVVGLLRLEQVANPPQHAGLEQKKRDLEEEIRRRYAGLDKAGLKSLPVLQAYAAHYKRFNKSYHVRLQLESVLFKDKSLPRVAALVEIMFMAELDNLLLTAGHDVEALKLPLTLDVGHGIEAYTALDNRATAVKPGDMFIADAEGVISSIINGPDQRTRITAATRRVLFTVYAPPGIGEANVKKHLQDIQGNVSWMAPGSRADTMEIYLA